MTWFPLVVIIYIYKQKNKDQTGAVSLRYTADAVLFYAGAVYKMATDCDSWRIESGQRVP